MKLIRKKLPNIIRFSSNVVQYNIAKAEIVMNFIDFLFMCVVCACFLYMV